MAAPAPPSAADRLPVAAQLGGSVQIRHVDAGSCNGCEVEIGSAFGPVYDAERYGARLVASPRHADALVVTGPVTRNMAEPLRRTYDAVPGTKLAGQISYDACECRKGKQRGFVSPLEIHSYRHVSWKLSPRGSVQPGLCWGWSSFGELSQFL